jgi:acetyl-CoA acetyltransferase
VQNAGTVEPTDQALALRGKYCIVGVGNTRYGKVPGVSALGHSVEAAASAIADAGLKREDIDAVLTKAPTSNFQMLWSAKVSEALGIQPAVTTTLDQAGASNTGLITYAIWCMELGLCKNAVIIYGDNPATGSRAAYARVAGGDAAYGYVGPAAGYALAARRHMHEYGTTAEQMGAVAVAHRKHASMNPNAQFQTPITLQDYLSSRWLVEPFRLLDSCPVSDGGAAIVVTSAERARDLPRKPVYILGFGQDHPAWELPSRPVWTASGAKRSGSFAFSMAGLGPADMDFAQLYDCFTIVPIITLEDYGFCGKGEGGAFVQGGRIELGGEIPLNTSGGLLSETGMPGMQLILEATRQLRGDCGPRQVPDAHAGVVSNQGGIMTTHATLVLGDAP